MSKRVYLVTMHTGNSLTVHSRKFVRGRTVVVEDENLVNYLKGHPNFTIVTKNVGDSAQASEILANEGSNNEAEAVNGGTNTAEDIESGMSPKTPVTNVAKNPTPVKRSGRTTTTASATH